MRFQPSNMKAFHIFTVLLFSLIHSVSLHHFVSLPPYYLLTLASNTWQIESSRFGIFDAPTVIRATCFGSLEIESTDGARWIILDTITSTRFSAESVKAFGCGCYKVHSRTLGRGISQLIYPSQKLDKSEIGFSRIRSIYRIRC